MCDTCYRSNVVIHHAHNGKTVCGECAESCDLCESMPDELDEPESSALQSFAAAYAKEIQ